MGRLHVFTLTILAHTEDGTDPEDWAEIIKGVLTDRGKALDWHNYLSESTPEHVPEITVRPCGPWTYNK